MDPDNIVHQKVEGSSLFQASWLDISPAIAIWRHAICQLRIQMLQAVKNIITVKGGQ